jgi:8-oxo-dGTP pyrophosphatase MutT (NUDIX family)
LEETGLDAQPVEIAEPYAYPLELDPDHRVRLPPGTLKVVVHTFVVDAPSGWEPVLDDEHDEYRWCSREEALGLLHWPEPREVLRSLA